MEEDLPLALLGALEARDSHAFHELARRMHAAKQRLRREDGLYLLQRALDLKMDEAVAALLGLGAAAWGLDVLRERLSAPDQAVLLLRAIEHGQRELVENLLQKQVRPEQTALGHNRSSYLVAAVQRGATELLPVLVRYGARVNERDRDGRTPLHHVVLTEGLESSVRQALTLELLRLLAVPEVPDRRGKDVFRTAEELGCAPVAEVLHEHAYAFGPQQVREARRANLCDVRLDYGKADGFTYRIGIPERPFLVGGDYDGQRDVDLEEAGRIFLSYQLAHPNVSWFGPFMEKLTRGEEFPLQELRRHVSYSSTRSFGEVFR